MSPNPKEADLFLNDSARAFEQLVDRLLADERFGERMAVHWFDLRANDTIGYHSDNFMEVSAYRPRNRGFQRQFALRPIRNREYRRRSVTGGEQPSKSRFRVQPSTTDHAGRRLPTDEYATIYQADRAQLRNAWLAATTDAPVP